MPILGDIFRKIAVARFSRTLSTLLSSGVPILQSLDITARTAGNVIIETAILKVRDGVERGESFVDPLKATEVFPHMVAQMIGIGEQTGALDAMLGKIADFYEAGSRCGDCQPADLDGANPDRFPRRHHRFDRHRDVPAAVHADRQAVAGSLIQQKISGRTQHLGSNQPNNARANQPFAWAFLFD